MNRLLNVIYVFTYIAALLLLSNPIASFADPAQTGPSAVQSSVAPLTVPGLPPLLSRDAAIILKVSSFDSGLAAVEQKAALQGAELLDSRTFVNTKGQKHGYVRLRVDASRLDAFRSQLRQVGVLYSESVAAEDQQPDYESIGRRAGQLQLHQQRLEGVLNNRKLRGSDILYIQDRLFRAGTDQQDLLQQQADMQLRSGRSLVYVELFEPNSLPPAPHRTVPLGQRFASSYTLAKANLNSQIARATTVSAYVVTFAPIWLPLLVIALLILTWLWRRRMLFVNAVVAVGRRLLPRNGVSST